jgi:hypothetical protein
MNENSSVDAMPASLNFRVIFPVVEELDEDSDLPFIDVVMIFPFGKEPDEDSGPPFIGVLVIIPVVKELDEDSGPPFVDVLLMNFPVAEALEEDGEGSFLGFMSCPVAWIKSIARRIRARGVRQQL